MSRFLERVYHQLRLSFKVFVFGLCAPVCVPFSRLWRLKVIGCANVLTNPFLTVETPLGAFFTEPLDFSLVCMAARAHNVSEAELLAITAILSQARVKRAFEIGTFDGRTTRNIARNLLPDGDVFTLNLSPDAEIGGGKTDKIDFQLSKKVVSGERFLGTAEASRITQLWGDSATFDFSPYSGSVDLVFIDGAHSEDYVESDTRSALGMLRPEGGLLLFHDATRYGVVRFLKKWTRSKNIPFRIVEGTTVGVVARVGNRFVDPVEYCLAKGRGEVR